MYTAQIYKTDKHGISDFVCNIQCAVKHEYGDWIYIPNCKWPVKIEQIEYDYRIGTEIKIYVSDGS